MVSVFEDARIEKDQKRVRRDKNLYKNSVHANVACDKCEMSPIIGIRYKSATKPNYDLCIDCESQFGSEDVFLKIKRPEDYLKYIEDMKAKLDEEDKSAFDEPEQPKDDFQYPDQLNLGQCLQL